MKSTSGFSLRPWLLDGVYLAGLTAALPWLIWRRWATGRYRRGLRAKLLGAIPAPPAGTGPIAWFHGVSVGEIHLLSTVVPAFQKRHPDWRIVVSSTTDTGIAEATQRFPTCHVVDFPFDFSWAVGQALSSIRPHIVILAESELWPNFLAEAQARRIPVVVINARMSPRSFARLSRLKRVARSLLLAKVTRFAVQAPEYAERLSRLGLPSSALRVTGSIKYDGATAAKDTPKARALQEWLKLPPRDVSERPIIWVAGSTHAPEEAIVLDTFAKLRAQFPRLRLILVPRHPDRFDEVAGLITSRGLSFVRRSQAQDAPATTPDIVLLDTIGELGAAWSLADLGYTGGSLDGKRGGQSMIEPAGYGVPTVFGPHVWNFRDAAQRLVEAGGAIMIRQPEDLEPTLARLLSDEALRVRRGRAAQELVVAQQGATTRTLDVIDEVLAGQ